MRRKAPSKTEPKWPPLPYEEWDFRDIPDDDDILLEATLYEYLRSSPMRESIVRWQHSKVLDSKFPHRLSYFVNEFRLHRREPYGGKPRREIFLEEAYHSDDSWLTKTPDDRDIDALTIAAIELSHTFTQRDLTVQEVISEIFECFRSGRIRLFLLRNLRCTLPLDVRALQAHWICLRYEKFPTPWLELPPDYTHPRSWASLTEDYTLLNEKDGFVEYDEQDYLLFDNPQVMPMVVLVNLMRPAKDIRKQMQDWASRTFHMRRTGPKATTGWLKRLSVYRLHHIGKLTADKAIDVVNKRGFAKGGGLTEVLPSTQNEQNWSADLSEAEADLQGNFVPAIYSSFGKLAPFG